MFSALELIRELISTETEVPGFTPTPRIVSTNPAKQYTSRQSRRDTWDSFFFFFFPFYPTEHVCTFPMQHNPLIMLSVPL